MTEASSHAGWTDPLPLVHVSAAEPAVDRPSVAPPSGVDASGRPWPPFAHGSEAEMARILDFYGVRWDYEPRMFPILWNLEGDVVESFSPDFYLPDMDLYLELTTLKQRLVRKKNRKLRRLRELYPDLRIKLFYARDFRAIMLKYGRLALADSLSGTLGQVASANSADIATDLAPTADAAMGDGDEPELRPGPAVEPGDAGVAGAGWAPGPRAADPARTARNRSRSRRRRAAAAARSAANASPDRSSQPAGHAATTIRASTLHPASQAKEDFPRR